MATHYSILAGKFYGQKSLAGYSPAAAAKSLQSCLTLCDPIDPAHRLRHPWDSPGKNTGVGCHFLLQCMKVKSLSHVRLFITLWTAAYQAPPSMGFSRQEYWRLQSMGSQKSRNWVGIFLYLQKMAAPWLHIITSKHWKGKFSFVSVQGGKHLDDSWGVTYPCLNQSLARVMELHQVV